MLKFIQGFSNHFDTNFLRLIKGHLQKIPVIHDESDLVEVKKYQNSTFIFVCQYISSRGSEATVRRSRPPESPSVRVRVTSTPPPPPLARFPFFSTPSSDSVPPRPTQSFPDARERNVNVRTCASEIIWDRERKCTHTTHRSYVNRHLTSAPSTTPFHRGHLLSETLTSRHRRRRPQLLPVTQPILGRLPKANV